MNTEFDLETLFRLYKEYKRKGYENEVTIYVDAMRKSFKQEIAKREKELREEKNVDEPKKDN